MREDQYTTTITGELQVCFIIELNCNFEQRVWWNRANYTGEPKWRYNSVIKYFKKSENYLFPGKWDDFTSKYHGKDGPLDISIPSYTGST